MKNVLFIVLIGISNIIFCSSFRYDKSEKLITEAPFRANSDELIVLHQIGQSLILKKQPPLTEKEKTRLKNGEAIHRQISRTVFLTYALKKN